MHRIFHGNCCKRIQECDAKSKKNRITLKKLERKKENVKGGKGLKGNWNRVEKQRNLHISNIFDVRLLSTRYEILKKFMKLLTGNDKN